MIGDVFAHALRAFGKRQPFRPFCIEFHSGDRLVVSRPEAIGRFGELFVYRGPDRGQRIFAGSSVCQLMDLPPTVTPS